MEVYPDLSIIGRGKDMQPYSYQRATEVHTGNHGTPNRNTHGPKRQRQPKTLKTPETRKTQPDSPQGGQSTTQRETGEGRARHVTGITDNITVARHVSTTELWNTAKQRTSETGLRCHRKHISPSLGPGEFGRAAEELGRAERFLFRQNANQLRPSISPTTADLARKDDKLHNATICRVNKLLVLVFLFLGHATLHADPGLDIGTWMRRAITMQRRNHRDIQHERPAIITVQPGYVDLNITGV